MSREDIIEELWAKINVKMVGDALLEEETVQFVYSEDDERHTLQISVRANRYIFPLDWVHTYKNKEIK